MSVDHVKRLAAKVLGVGVSRIWIDPSKHNELVTVITREEVKKLIKEGVIKVKPKKRNSRYRIKLRQLKRKKGRRRGPGKRKGPRFDEKELWVARIRALRKFLRKLKSRRKISPKTYRRLYRLAKGGYFRSVSHLKAYIEEHKLMER
ncbi:MAG: 50S ribosomal protein L19e [Thermoprotei archaeon]|nr:MAG: 50S ribosomal protein L19e [Thermoprotei archaeon]RLF01087.1 MAG: 50S ribosomal protein L19e [Thermoprotei archaeon]